MTLGPVNRQASLVTLKIPAPIRIPTNAASDSPGPALHASSIRWELSYSTLIFPLIHSRVDSDLKLFSPSQLRLRVSRLNRSTRAAPAPMPGPSRCVRAPACRRENELFPP